MITKNFLHSGGMGDIIYSMPTIIKLCRLHDCNARLYIKARNHYDTVTNQHKALKRLLETQSYIAEVLEYPSTPYFVYDSKITIDFDLDLFRRSPGLTKEHLIISHLRVFNFSTPDWRLPWFQTDKLPSAKMTGKYCLINRTGRYPDPKINWKQVYDKEILPRFNDSEVHFVGLPIECENFKRLIGRPIHRLETADIFDMARYLKDAAMCFGSQSSFLSLCIAMGKEYFVELSPIECATVYTGSEHVL